MKFSRAFTMVELIFVIVVLGILAAIALPKFAQTRELADIAKGRGDVATIRAGIVNERQARTIKADFLWITASNLDGNVSGKLFAGILTYPMTNSATASNWSGGSGTYHYWVGDSDNTFTYTPADGKFLCTAGTECSKLVD